MIDRFLIINCILNRKQIKSKQKIQKQIGIENDLDWKSKESRLSDINS